MLFSGGALHGSCDPKRTSRRAIIWLPSVDLLHASHCVYSQTTSRITAQYLLRVNIDKCPVK